MVCCGPYILNCFRSGMAIAGAVPCERARQIRPERNGAEWRRLVFGRSLAARDSASRHRWLFTPGVPDSMKSCASKWRARRIGRPDRVHDRELAFLEKRLQRLQAGMQAEETVEVDGCIGAATPRAAESRCVGRMW